MCQLYYVNLELVIFILFLWGRKLKVFISYFSEINKK
jgi:hypothetical protein